jgi:translation initiation factor 2D
LKAILNAYVSDKQLVNPRDQSYINVGTDNVLVTSLSISDEFMKRDEVLKRLVEKMQPWHEVKLDGKEAVLRYVLPILSP